MPELITRERSSESVPALVPRSNRLFRQEALAHLAAPDEIDSLLQVATPRSWLFMLSLGSIVGLALLWSIFGRIPVTVTGRGVLIQPGKVLGLHAIASGQMQALHIREGDYVHKGMVVAFLDQAGLRQRLEQERSKLAGQRAEYTAIQALQETRERLVKNVLELRRKDLERRVQDSRSLAQHSLDVQERSIRQQRESLAKALELSKATTAFQKERVDIEQGLLGRNAASKIQVNEAKQIYLQILSKEIELHSQLQQVEVRTAQSEDAYAEKMAKISEMQSQINDTLTEAKKVEQQTLELAAGHKLALEEIQRNIAKLELDLEKQSNVVCEHSGRVSEITAAVGQVISPGTKIAAILEEDPTAPLICLGYFQVKDGKRIRSGMSVRTALDSVQRERHGSLISRVQATTPFPITREAASNSIGNSELARALIGDSRQLEVVIDLNVDPSTPSGYAWTSSRGPNSQLTVGTTANIDVELEARRPISFLLPFLRGWVGSD